MNILYRLFIVLALMGIVSFGTIFSTTINIFLEPAPITVQREIKEKLIAEGVIQKKVEKLGKREPTKVGKKLLKNHFRNLLPKVSGFVALYGAYVDYSNKNGIITLPLLHKKPKLYIVVTPRIKMVTLYKNTIAYERFSDQTPSEIYLAERKVDKDKTTYWRITKEKEPEHKRINPLSVVILTKPKNLVVPTGDFLATRDINLVLPKIYVVGNIGKPKPMLDFLDIAKFFEQIDEKEKVKAKVVRKLIQNN
jgi:hypothetical protein